MPDIPIEIDQRLTACCAARGIEVQELRGYGVDGYVWQTRQKKRQKKAAAWVASFDHTRRLGRARLAFRTRLKVFGLTMTGFCRRRSPFARFVAAHGRRLDAGSARSETAR
jgi:hypothetical protein